MNKSRNAILMIVCLTAICCLVPVTGSAIEIPSVTDKTAQVPLEKESRWNATDQSIFGQSALAINSQENQASKFQQIINLAASEGKQIYVPAGEYIINQGITLRSNVKVIGDEEQATIFKNTTDKAVSFTEGGYQETQGISFQHLFFESISIFARVSKNFTLTDAVFFHPVSDHPVILYASNGARIMNNLFLRDKEHSTLGLANRALFVSGYATGNLYRYMEDVVVENNVFGLKINEMDAIKSFSNEGTIKNIEKLQLAISHNKISLSNEQNFITTGINSYSTLKNTLIKDNLFYHVFENEDTAGVGVDHAIYLRGAQDIQVVGNHLRGLHNGPAGGFKFKSGRNITIMNNYLRNTGIIMYETPEYGLGNNFAEGTVSELSRWLVANNIFDFKQWQSNYAIGIEYNQHTGSGNVFDGVFMDNHYENYHNIPGNRRRGLLIRNGNGFRGKSTFVSGNTRSDTAEKSLLVEGWTIEDYEGMPVNWETLVNKQWYERYQNHRIPVRNTFPASQEVITAKGIAVESDKLVSNTHDKDEIPPEMELINSDVFNQPGKHKANIQLTYADSSIVTVNSMIIVTDLVVNDSSLFVGESWNAQTNFVSGIDKQGELLTFDKITLSNTEKVNTSKAGTYTVTYNYEGISKEVLITVKERSPEEVLMTIDPYKIGRTSAITGSVTGTRAKYIRTEINGEKKVLISPSSLMMGTFSYYLPGIKKNDKTEIVLFDSGFREVARQELVLKEVGKAIMTIEPYEIGRTTIVRGIFTGEEASYIRAEVNGQKTALVNPAVLGSGQLTYYLPGIKQTDKVEIVLFDGTYNEVGRQEIAIKETEKVVVTSSPYIVGQTTLINGHFTGSGVKYIRAEVNQVKKVLVSPISLLAGTFSYYLPGVTNNDQLELVLFDANYQEVAREVIEMK